MLSKSFGNGTGPTVGLNPIGITKPTYTYIFIKILTDPLKLTINGPSMTQIHSDTQILPYDRYYHMTVTEGGSPIFA